MSRVSELISCVKIYNLCNHCDYFKCGECSVDDVNCKEEIEKQIVSEIRADAVDEFMRLLSDKGYFDVFESEFTISHYDLLTIEKQLKEQKK